MELFGDAAVAADVAAPLPVEERGAAERTFADAPGSAPAVWLGYLMELLDDDKAGACPLEASLRVDRGMAARALAEPGCALGAWLGYLIELFEDDTTELRPLERSLPVDRGEADRMLAELWDWALGPALGYLMTLGAEPAADGRVWAEETDEDGRLGALLGAERELRTGAEARTDPPFEVGWLCRGAEAVCLGAAVRADADPDCPPPFEDRCRP
jgi:hypothetical protein